MRQDLALLDVIADIDRQVGDLPAGAERQILLDLRLDVTG